MNPPITIAPFETSSFVPLPSEDGGAERLEGDPSAQIHTLCENADIWSGIVLIQPSTFRYPVEHAGAVHLLEGQVTITTDGVSQQAGAGDVVYMSPGVESIWKVTEPIREFFVVFLGGEHAAS